MTSIQVSIHRPGCLCLSAKTPKRTVNDRPDFIILLIGKSSGTLRGVEFDSGRRTGNEVTSLKRFDAVRIASKASPHNFAFISRQRMNGLEADLALRVAQTVSVRWMYPPSASTR